VLFFAGIGVGYLIHKPTSSPAAAPTTATTPTAATGIPATTPSAAPSPTKAALHPLGEDAHGSVVTVTAYAYKQPTAQSAPPPEQAGYVWASADVKVCSVYRTLTVSHLPWLLVYPDATVIEPSSTGYRQFQQPEFPWGDQHLDAGRCMRGWITYAVPADKRPTMVEYQGRDDPAVDWKVA